jgi:hypothetical protein
MTEEDKSLSSVVAEFNERIDLLNGFYTPKFSLDLKRCSKVRRRTGHVTKYHYNFSNLYVDGIHSGPDLPKEFGYKLKFYE